MNIKLTAICIAQSKISDLSTLHKINETFKHLREIDLEDNLLSSWNDIFNVLDQIKNLRIINIR
jgi:hypothetical protein